MNPTEKTPGDDTPQGAVPFTLIVAVWMIVALGLIALLWAARGFFIPLLLGVTIAYVLRPAVEVMVSARIPRGFAAFITVMSMVGVLVGGIYTLGDDAARLLESLPKVAKTVRISLQDRSTPQPRAITQVREAAKEIDRAAAAAAGTTNAPVAPSSAPGVGARLQEYVVAQGVLVILTAGQALFVFLLTWFLLSEGDTFKRKLLRIVGTSLERKKITVRILDDIDRQVQRQVGTMVVANVLIGVGTAIIFSLLGVEQALLWGVLAGVLHFIPYVGQAVITGLSTAAAYVQFEAIGPALTVGGATLVLSFLIGTVLMTVLQSRASRVNATVLFVAILFFGWLWGAWGLVLAAPLVAMLKSVCDNVEQFAPARELLSGTRPAAPAPVPVPD